MFPSESTLTAEPHLLTKHYLAHRGGMVSGVTAIVRYAPEHTTVTGRVMVVMVIIT